MTLLKKLGTFARMSRKDRLLICEAIVLLGMARFIVLAIPFRMIAPWLSTTPGRQFDDEFLLKRIRRAVTTAARNVPWNAVCLPQALAAKAMLARRGCGSTFHLGAGTNDEGKLIAHAWLACGGKIVVGAEGMAGVTQVARFG
jgi:hypothetical protein